MAARVNIEACWWTDPRRGSLARVIGSQSTADGVVIAAWVLAQEFWKHGRKLVPKGLFDTLEASSHLLAVGLAEVREGGVYVRGSSAYLSWIAERAAAGSTGGKKSAEKRAKKPKQTPSKAKQDEANAKQVQPSSSFSSSSSVSDSGSASTSGSFNSVGANSETGTGAGSKGITEGGSPNPTGAFIGAYTNAYKAQYGERARPSLDGKTLGLIKLYLADTPIERAVRMIETYLSMKDAWFITKAHDFGTFRENLTKVGLALDTGQAPTASQGRMAEKSSHAEDQLRRIAEGKL